jgi:hypothetical protein
VLDALECVLSVYFSSSVYHNNRAAFILCDGLVELTCKAKAEANGWRPVHIDFLRLLQLGPVNLDPANGGVGKKCSDSHLIRNKMHHVNAMQTVTEQACADSILDAVDCIEHCYPGAKAALTFKLRVALRVVTVMSSLGTWTLRSDFQREMNEKNWRARKNPPRVHEIVIAPGNRAHWGLVVMDAPADIEAILNRIGAP